MRPHQNRYDTQHTVDELTLIWLEAQVEQIRADVLGLIAEFRRRKRANPELKEFVEGNWRGHPSC